MKRDEIQSTEIVPANGDVPSVLQDPQAQVEFGKKAAKALMAVVEAKPNKLILGGKTYVDVADWEMIGHFFNISAKTEWTKKIDGVAGLVEGYEARVVLINQITGIEIGGGEALCSRDEKNWKDKPEFQLKSMAQTRATGKALRNTFAWIVTLAGYEGTPAEEMRGIVVDEKLPPCPKCEKKTLKNYHGRNGLNLYCVKGDGGCGAKFKTLEDIKNPAGNRIAEIVKNISAAEIKFKQHGKGDEYKKILDTAKVDHADEITDEKMATEILLKLSTIRKAFFKHLFIRFH